METRHEFVLRALAPGANVSELCREYGVSRKTGYKWLARFKETGHEGLSDMSRQPQRKVQTEGEVVLRIAELRAAHRTWGPKKLRVLLARELGTAPSVKTIARILERLGEPRLRRVRIKASPERQKPEGSASAPNDMWTVDFKGWWRTRDGKRCEPLTVRDAFSRFVLCIHLVTSTRMQQVQAVFLQLFKQYGLPRAMQMDNGTPFGCTRARGGLSKLSAWWVSLGIDVVFGRPAHPQDNGAHERMHRDMALELERDVAVNRRQQQLECDRWVHEFNHVRPHEALGMACPGTLYRRSARPYREARAPRYPMSFEVKRVAKNGSTKAAGKQFYVGAGYAEKQIGIERIDSQFARLWFYDRDLGLVDLASARSTRGATAVDADTPNRRKATRVASKAVVRGGGTRERVCSPQRRRTKA